MRKPAELLGGGHGCGWGMRVPTVMPPTPPRPFLRRGNQIPLPLSLSPSGPTPEGSQPFPQRAPHLTHTNLPDLMGADTPHSILTARCGLFSE